MRIAVIADIHGNLPALEAVLADIERRDVDRNINGSVANSERQRSRPGPP